MLVKPFSFKKTSDTIFEIRKAKKHAILFLIIALMIGFLAMTSAYFQFIKKDYFSFLITFSFAITGIIWAFYSTRLIILGEVFLFDNKSNRIILNTKEKAKYSDISSIIMEEKHSDGSWYYLYLLKTNGKKIAIADMSIDSYLIETGQAIAGFTKMYFTKKLI